MKLIILKRHIFFLLIIIAPLARGASGNMVSNYKEHLLDESYCIVKINDDSTKIKPDRIYKKAKSVIDCKIISITDQEVRYILITDESKQIRTIKRSEIERIDYNGENEKIAPNVAKENELKDKISNRIYKKDKSIIDCKITGINEKEVQYIVVTDDSRKVRIINRKYIDRIEQTDGFGITTDVVKSKQKNINPFKGKSIKERLSASVLLGITGSLPFGREIDTLRKIANAQKVSSDSVNQFDRGINPLISFHIGVLAKLQLRPKLYLSSGLIYGRRGFSQFNQYKYRNPIYQYDQLLVNKSRYQLDIIELPICLHWTLSKKLALETGIGVAFQIGSAEQVVTTDYEVTINGKKDPDESTDTMRDTYSLKDVSSTVIPSAQMTVIYQVREKWHIRFNTQFTHNLFNTGSHIKNGVLNVGITYKLF